MELPFLPSIFLGFLGLFLSVLVMVESQSENRLNLTAPLNPVIHSPPPSPPNPPLFLPTPPPPPPPPPSPLSPPPPPPPASPSTPPPPSQLSNLRPPPPPLSPQSKSKHGPKKNITSKSPPPHRSMQPNPHNFHHPVDKKPDRKINFGKKIGLLFAGIAGILQVAVIGFIVFKGWQISKLKDREVHR